MTGRGFGEDAQAAAAQSADNAVGDGLLQPHGRTHCEQDIAHPQFGAVAEGGRRESIGFDFDQGDVRLGIGPDDFGGIIPALSGDFNFQFIGLIHHMIIGEDIAIAGDDHPRPETGLNRFSRQRAAACG